MGRLSKKIGLGAKKKKAVWFFSEEMREQDEGIHQVGLFRMTID